MLAENRRKAELAGRETVVWSPLDQETIQRALLVLDPAHAWASVYY